MSATSSSSSPDNENTASDSKIDVSGVLAIPLFARPCSASTELHQVLLESIGDGSSSSVVSPNLFLRLFRDGKFDPNTDISSIQFLVPGNANMDPDSKIVRVGHFVHPGGPQSLVLLLDMHDDKKLVVEQMASRLSTAEQENIILQEQVEGREKAAPPNVKEKGKKKKKEAGCAQENTPSADHHALVAQLSSQMNGLLIREKEHIQRTGNLETTVKTLETTVKTLRKTTYALQRRVLLDQAREKIIDDFSLSIVDYPTNTALRIAAATHLRPKLHSSHVGQTMSASALDMIFLPNNIRRGGDVAAHAASSEQGSAVLDSGLTRRQRGTLKEIFKYIHGYDPTLEDTQGL